jgi:hypothetical protein
MGMKSPNIMLLFSEKRRKERQKLLLAVSVTPFEFLPQRG